MGGPLVEQVDLEKPPLPALKAGEAMVVLRFHAPGMVGDNRVTFFAWDATRSDVIRDASKKPQGFRVKYSYSMFGGKKGAVTLRLAIVPAGDYVMGGRTFNAQYTDSFCFGAPRFTLTPGEVAYLGDYEMFALEKAPDRELRNAMRYGSRPEEARAGLATLYPDEAARLAAWRPVNGATFACDGDEFTAYAVPDAAGGGPTGH